MTPLFHGKNEMAKVIQQNVGGEIITKPSVVIDGVEQPHEPCGQVYAKLSAVHIDGKTGKRTEYPCLSTQYVTNVFLAIVTGCMRANAGNLASIQLFKYHGVGTGTATPAATDTALGAETIYVYGSERTSDGTRAGSAATYVSVSTVTFVTVPTSLAITEHGLFDTATIGEGNLLDRSKFTAITVVTSDQIIFTYTLTCTGSE